MSLRFRAGLFLFFIIIILLFEAWHPVWSTHLHTDARVYFERANYFWKHHGLTDLTDNEYQPGALIFYIALSLPIINQLTFDNYLLSLFLVNILLIILLAGVYEKIGGIGNVFIFGLFLFFLGPIVLYRFDFYVMFLTILAILLCRRHHYLLAVSILSFATLVKIFPVVLLPYFVLLALMNRGIKFAVITLFAFISSYIGFLLTFMAVFKASFQILGTSFHFLSQIPIHTESLWGSIMTILPKITTGEYARGKGAWGIFGIAPEYTIGDLKFYNYIWILPLGLCYFWLILHSKKMKSLNIRFCILLIFIFLVFSKILHLQYTLWFILLIPLIPFKELMQQKWIINMFFVITASFLHYYVYPLRYTEWTREVYITGDKAFLIWIIALRNLIFLILGIRFYLELKFHDINKQRI